MSGQANNAFISLNFAFLMQYDKVLVHHAALAERYMFDDPNSALLKLRQFGELLAQHTAAYTGIAVEAHESQRELIDKLYDSEFMASEQPYSATARCALMALRGSYPVAELVLLGS